MTAMKEVEEAMKEVEKVLKEGQKASDLVQKFKPENSNSEIETEQMSDGSFQSKSDFKPFDPIGLDLLSGHEV